MRLDTLTTPWKRGYALRRRAMLAALRVTTRLHPMPELERLGSDYGGWTIPTGSVDGNWRCLCAGAGIDVTFDLELARRYNATVITVDPTDEARDNAAPHDELQFVHAALAAQDGELTMFEAADPTHKTLSSDDLQRTGRAVSKPARALSSFGVVDLLKLDIEGAEYDVFPHVGEGVKILCVEMHPTRGIRTAVTAVKALERQGFRLVARRGADLTFVR